MSWILTIISAIICGFLVGTTTSYAMRPSNKDRKDIHRRAIRTTVICIVIVLGNFYFGVWNGIGALVLAYIVNLMAGAQNKA